MTRRWGAAIAVVMVLGSGCGGDEAEPALAAEVGDISISGAWARPTAGEGSNTAMYLTVSNDGAEADTLAAADGAACEVTELHMTTIEDDVMTMTPVTEGILVPGRSSVTLGPGGLHVMCIGVTDALVEGATTEVTLDFANAGAITLVVDVRSDQ